MNGASACRITGAVPTASTFGSTRENSSRRNQAAQRNLRYASVLHEEREIPAWIDGVLRKALHPNPLARYDTLSEYVYDLRHPNQAFLNRARLPLVERHPVRFWKAVSAVLAVMVLALLYLQFGTE